MKQFHLFAVVTLLAALLCPKLDAQNSSVNYDLENYKLPYLKRQTLEFDLSSYGDNSINRRKYDETITDKSNQYNAELGGRYDFLLNTYKFQISQSIYADLPSISFNSSENQYRNYKRKTFNSSLTYTGSFREYVKGKFFLEQAPEFTVGFDSEFRSTQNKSNEIIVEDEDAETMNFHSDFSLPLLAGYGRIERVEDARLAVYILDELTKAGIITREVTEDEITQLAHRISEVMNERFFDARDKKIWELEQIDSILHDLNLIEEADISYFTILNDNWDYAAGPVRSSGFRTSGGVAPRILYSNNEFESEVTDTLSSWNSHNISENRTMGIDLVFNLSYHKPINLYWQLAVSNTLGYTFEWDREVLEQVDDNWENKDEIKNNGLFNNTYFGLYYYPNSRTSMGIGTNLMFSTLKFYPDEEDRDDYKEVFVYNRNWLNINYYISPALRLDLNCSYYLNYRKYDITEYSQANNNFRYNLSLTYKLL